MMIVKKLFSPLLFIYCFVFLVLNSIWILPDTLALRYMVVCLGIMATLLLARDVKWPEFSIHHYFSVICLIGLFLWVVIHRYFITPLPELMDRELGTIWKRALLEGIFALGFGILIQLKNIEVKKYIYPIILIIVAPLFLFYLSFYLKIPHLSWNYTAPEKPLYIPKYQVVFFLVIAYAWGLYLMDIALKNAYFKKVCFLMALLLGIILAIFLLNGRNGFLYIGMIQIVFIGRLILKYRKNIRLMALVIVFIFCTGLIAYQHIKTNLVWINLFEDIQVASHTDTEEYWKIQSDYEIKNIKNASGNNVSVTTYYRTAWLIEGSKLIPQFPLGYGLIENSFKYIAQNKWTNTLVFHTHSGLLDLTLGLGIPGILLLFGCGVDLIRKSYKNNAKNGSENMLTSALWVLPMIFLAFLTSELSEAHSFEVLISYLAFYTGLTLECKVKVN